MASTARAAVLAVTVLACGAAPGSAAASTLLRLDGIGPLKLGMNRVDAVKTGWMSDRGTGCPLEAPVPTTYQLDGAPAPRALVGTVTFRRDKLRNITVTRGVRTAAGVIVGRTTPSGMARLYRRAGFAATVHYESLFRATFVDVRRKSGRAVTGAIATGRAVRALSIPRVEVCE